MICAGWGSVRCMEMLLRRGANIRALNAEDNMNVLHYASQRGRSDILLSLYNFMRETFNEEEKEDLINFLSSTRARGGVTPLMLAIVSGDPETVRGCLITFTCSPFDFDKLLQDPVWYAERFC